MILADRPKSVVVASEPRENATLLRVYVGSGDIANVVGKQGQVAQSIRTILAEISKKQNHRYYLDITEIPTYDRPWQIVSAPPTIQSE